MADDLPAIEQLAGAMLRKAAPGERRKLLRSMVQALRASQAARIARQQDPDGTPFAPRKAQPTTARRRAGAIRDRAMFRKLRQAKYLRQGATANEAWVGFSGRVSRIARFHQEGLEDAPAPGRRLVRYPRRLLLGVTEEERQAMLDAIFEAVKAPAG